ncbi:protein of unknown function DUF190 [Desulfobulbus propionicus DSM 2032]|jgi:PII-like signaling protein|uniref:PII-like signaling protein n=1 Tax=Desulfobulbus propionicus (strain ATCC 33891 / DSM 2032 / VKM B-1956 / 1pr3) TaxID=577650 RepID=A0A7U4DPB5_DESPD|nr:DUF190 domain-containing protein [Desulfobulbus propionicus]ADW17887.1 protein of unknown function DUF190 [Desulfobulbus propionicus DSM 2032]
MHGYQLTFFTQQDRSHKGLPVAKWLVEQARDIGIGGATLIPAAEGYGHDRRLRSVHFFELADQPLQVTMAVSEMEAERLFARIKEEGVNVFFVKTPIEFGMTGEL